MMIDKLITKIKQMQNPTVVGLDPRLDYIPEFIKREAFSACGETPEGVAHAFYEFNKQIIDVIYDIVPAVKPQIAMYEQFGTAGLACYIKTVRYAKSKGLIVIGDAKRSDIASTAESYSDGHIGRVKIGGAEFEPIGADFLTVNPYLGSDSVEPFLKNCKAYEKGIFVLVKTSNAGSGDIQDIIAGDRPIYEHVGALTAKWGEGLIGEYGFSEVCAVVGATFPEQAKRLRELMPHTFFLVPGYGAQGGTAADVAVCFNKDGIGAIVNSSRGIIAAYQKKPKDGSFDERDFAKAAREAALAMKNDINKEIK